MRTIRGITIVLITLLLFTTCSKDSSNPELQNNNSVQKYTLKVTAGEGGTVSTAGGTYEKGFKITVTANPDSEYVFANWSNGSTSNPLDLTMNNNVTITANFKKKTYALSVDIVGQGIVTEEIVNQGKTSTDYNSGTTVKLTAEPSEEWVFASWSGALQSIDNPVELTLTEAKEITAHFEIIQYSLNVTSGEGGSVNANEGMYDSGSEVTVTATPDNDFIFSHWSDDSEENPRTIGIDSNVALTAIFQNKYEIENGNYIYVGFISDRGEIYYFDEPQPWVFGYNSNEATTCGTVYNDLASFPLFKDIGYVPGKPDDNLSDVMIARNTVHRSYLNGGVYTSWLLRKIDESEIPFRRTHEEIMDLVQGKGFWSDPIYSQIDPLQPETYVIAFLADAERHGVDLSFVDVNKILVRFREEGFAGLSHLYCFDDDRVEISYNIAFWNSASYFDIQNERLTVMYHELGHDILNSGHPPTGSMKQFMNQALGDSGPIVWDDSNPMFSFRRMVDDMFSGVGLNYECNNGAKDYTSGSSSAKGVVLSTSFEECFPRTIKEIPKFN
jgi:hypothetical protein